MVEHAQGFDRIGDCDSTVANEHEVLPVLRVRCSREVVRAEVHTRSRLVEVDNDELMMHPYAAAARRLRLERLGDVLTGEL